MIGASRLGGTMQWGRAETLEVFFEKKPVTCKQVDTGVKLLVFLQLYFLSLGLSLGVASPNWTSKRRRKMKF